MKKNEEIFTQIYENKDLSWGSNETESGPGSTLSATRHIRKNLEFLLKNLPIKTLCDIPCGDFHFMDEVEFGEVKYIGCDIVKSLVERNKNKYGNKNREFLHLDIIDDKCPTSDLVFCKDLFLHISNENIRKVVNKIRLSDAEYFMSTTEFLPVIAMPGGKYGKINAPEANVDVPPENMNGFLAGRPINLFLPPFNFPEANFIVGSTEQYPVMALWNTKELPDFGLTT